MESTPGCPADATAAWHGHLTALLACPTCSDGVQLEALLVSHLCQAGRRGEDWRALYARIYAEWSGRRPDLPAPDSVASLVEREERDWEPPAWGNETERWRLGHLHLAELRLERAVAELVRYYRRIEQPARALPHAERLLVLGRDAEQKARWCLGLGGLLEELEDFTAAAEMYRRILPLEPTDPHVAYFGHNNLGYCLVQLGRYAEAEPVCRRAVQLDPTRHNAHKNLGLALAGQGQLREAARCLAAATERCPQDPRALRHLEELVAAHPEILTEEPALAGVLQACRELVRKVGWPVQSA